MSNNQIIFISGWGTDSSIWDTIVDKLEDPVSFVSWWECLGNKSSNNSLFKLLSETNSPVLLIGWSLGGMIALSGAIDYPDKVSGLVLVSSSARMVHDKKYVGADPRVLKAMKYRLKADKKGLLDDFATMGISPAIEDLHRNEFIEKALEIDNCKLSEGLSYLQNFDLRDKLDNIHVPVNIIHGEYDKIMNPANALFLRDNLLNANLDIVSGVGHFMIQCEPGIILKNIKKLLNSLAIKL